MEELKKHGIKQPAGIKISENAGSGLKEEGGAENKGNDEMIEEGKSVQGGDTGPGMTELVEENERLKDQLVKLNMDMKEKNENMLNMLDEIEEIKI